MVRDGSFGGNWPIIGGHEPAGEVVAVGDNAEEVSVGDRVVALLPKDPCGRSKGCEEHHDRFLLMNGWV